ncbi:MAG: hypothetical protein ACOX3V_09095 [Bacillota bacterium]|jgi:hypothetical protein
MSAVKRKERVATRLCQSGNVIGFGYGRRRVGQRDERVLTVLVKDKESVLDCPQLETITRSPNTEILEVGEITALPKTLEPR